MIWTYLSISQSYLSISKLKLMLSNIICLWIEWSKRWRFAKAWKVALACYRPALSCYRPDCPSASIHFLSRLQTCARCKGRYGGSNDLRQNANKQRSASVSHFLGKKMLNHDNRTKRYLHKVFCLMRCVIGDYICIFTKNRKFRNISRNLDVNVAVSLLRNWIISLFRWCISWEFLVSLNFSRYLMNHCVTMSRRQ